ncbi:type II secretion system F family protein [Vibrio hepatarius]|uniref:type II secretion system F family protein n=1 Tax=Vibrio hepatarius TaxID=171383 RepID=UPI001C07FCCD|nr:type II secretion system F family protein [Vibrio hepatarius]MBU2896208.1 type II secretion system F family protein [Vibrio hepatarius]
MNISLDIVIPIAIAIVVTYIMRKFIISYNRKLAMRRFTDSDNLSRFDKLMLSFFSTERTSLFSDGTDSTYIERYFSDGVYKKEKVAKMIIGLAGVLLVQLFSDELGVSDWILKFALMGGFYVVGMIILSAWVRMRKADEIKNVSEGVPYAVDLMAICVQTGTSVEAMLVYVAKDIKLQYPLLSLILLKTYDRSNVIGTRAALEELSNNIDIPEVRSLAYSLNQSIKFGTSIYDVLMTLSSDIRELKLLTIEEKVGALSAKMSVPLILFILMPIVILITAPGIFRLMGAS